jgi:hypothetical protein
MSSRRRTHRVAKMLLIAAAITSLSAAGVEEAKGQVASPARDASPFGAFAGALVGGTAGAIGGMLIGAGGDCDEICDEILWGFLVGEALGAGLGAHAFNRGRGNLGLTLLASGGIAAAGLAVQASMGGEGWVLLGSAMAQVVAVTVVQVKTSPFVSMTPMVQPSADGIKAGLSLRW